MAFFKFRKSNEDSATAPLLPDSLEEMRRRAKYRLIGSAVLVLIGVLGFPLLFDKQPRPISVDMPIDIPDRNKAKPLALPATAVAVAPVSAPAIIEEKSTPEPTSVAQPAPKIIASPEPVQAAKAPEKAPEKAAEKHAAPTAVPVPAPVPKPVAKVDESEKVKALLNGQSIDKATEAVVGRYVVQVGAFADPVKAREARVKLEQAGLKTYTHVAETKDGTRIRVRVGPFDTKAEADKTAQKVKALKLAAAVLTL
jgi:DedD protein